MRVVHLGWSTCHAISGPLLRNERDRARECGWERERERGRVCVRERERLLDGLLPDLICEGGLTPPLEALTGLTGCEC